MMMPVLRRPPRTRGAVVRWTVLALAGCGTPGPPATEDTTTIVSVEVGSIVRTTLRSYVEASGTIEPQPGTPSAPSARATVASPVGGLMAEIRCAEGQRVSKGATLFRLDSRVADVAVAKATQAVAFAERAFERQQQLGAGEATSQKLYQEAEQALALARNELANTQTQRALLDITAPLTGTVVSVEARLGDAVDPTKVLAEIVDLARLAVTAAVRTADVPRVEIGQPVELVDPGTSEPRAAPDPGKGVSVVTFIGATVDAKTDTVAIRASVPRNAGLRPGQFLAVRILTGECRDCLAVPVESLVSDGEATLLAVVHGDVATKRPVHTGMRDGRLAVVEGEGLVEGLTVVTAGAYGLPPESKIRVIRP